MMPDRRCSRLVEHSYGVGTLYGLPLMDTSDTSDDP